MNRRQCSRSCQVMLPAVLACLFAVLCGCRGAGVAASDPAQQNSPGSGARNASYTIDNKLVTLVDGMAEIPAAPGASSTIRTKVWNEPSVADLNGDGVDDAVVVLTHETGGSGTFFYLAAAVAGPNGYVGTAGVFLGDRIDSRSLEVREGRVTLTYMTRRANQSFAERPTVEVIRDFILDTDGRTLAEVARNFEGEADPNRMSLQMKPWNWLRTTSNDDTVKEPRDSAAFTLTFTDDSVQGTTDCNGFRGEYTSSERRLSFKMPMAMTQMFCADTQEEEFLTMLENVESYFFTSNGRLILELKYDSGNMVFN